MLLGNSLHLTKIIFDSYSQIDLFAHYLNIPSARIEYCLEHRSHSINNPLRVDSNPSLSFAYFKSNAGPKLRMRDWGDSSYNGDIFDLVGSILNLNPSKKMDFINICEHIITSRNTDMLISRDDSQYKEIVADKTIDKIEVVTRSFTNNDYTYWLRNGVIKEMLEHHRVYCIDYAYLNGDCIYVHKSSDVCYGYLDFRYQDTDMWELYFPSRKHLKVKTKGLRTARFITNDGNNLRSLYNMSGADVLLITKSKKDVMALDSLFYNHSNRFYNIYNSDKFIDIINFKSETVTLTSNEIEILTNNYEHIYLNPDFDKTGIALARKHLDLYGLKSLFFTNGKGGTFDFKAKDPSEFILKHGDSALVNIILGLIYKLHPNAFANL